MSHVLSLSIVSHGHGAYIERLLRQLAALGRRDFEVILTLNVPEALALEAADLPYPLRIVRNGRPRGFSANHNAAFKLSKGANFVILNPDIRLIDDPFPPLLAMLDGKGHSIFAPLIVCPDGSVEDSARHFPSPYRLVKRFAGRALKVRLRPEAVPQDDKVLRPDWVAGMFLLIPRATYQMLNGFNEAYFLYFEDVDFCARAQLAGCQIVVNKNVRVIHEAQRDSHRKMRYLLWHSRSACQFFASGTYFRLQKKRLFGARRRLSSR